MPKKLRLDSDYDNDFTILGIASHLHDYRLIWSLNEKMHLHLIKMDDLKIFQDKKNEFNKFSMFYYEDVNTFKNYYFISNTGENGLLFPELKQINYLMFLKGNISSEMKKELIQNISSIVNVLTIYPISLSLIKNIDNFLLDIELHMLEVTKKDKESKVKLLK